MLSIVSIIYKTLLLMIITNTTSQRSISDLYLLVTVVYRRLQSNYVIPLPLKYMYTNMGELAIDTIYVHSQIEGTSILLHN